MLPAGRTKVPKPLSGLPVAMRSDCAAVFNRIDEQVALTRVGQGIGDAACCPFAASILKDNFGPDVIGSAMGTYLHSVFRVEVSGAGAFSAASRVYPLEDWVLVETLTTW